MSQYEEDTNAYSYFTSDESSLEDSDTFSVESCVNESPITLMPYTESDIDVFTVKLPSEMRKFKIGSCMSKEELSGALLSDQNTDTPDYIMCVYTTPRQSRDHLTGMTGKPTIRTVIRLMSSQIYITAGSAKRIMEASTKTWYALPLFGGKRRRIGNVSGLYGASMNHGQIPGFLVYKLYTREEIRSGIKAVETLDDYLITPEQYLLYSPAPTPAEFVKNTVAAILGHQRLSPEHVFEHGLPHVNKIMAEKNIMSVLGSGNTILWKLDSGKKWEFDVFEPSETFVDALFKNDTLYTLTPRQLYITKPDDEVINNNSGADFSCLAVCGIKLLLGNRDGEVQIVREDLNPNLYYHIQKVSNFSLEVVSGTVCNSDTNDDEYIYIGDKSGSVDKFRLQNFELKLEGSFVYSDKRVASIHIYKNNLYIGYEKGTLALASVDSGTLLSKVRVGSGDVKVLYVGRLVDKEYVILHTDNHLYMTNFDLTRPATHIAEAEFCTIDSGYVYIQKRGEMKIIRKTLEDTLTSTM